MKQKWYDLPRKEKRKDLLKNGDLLGFTGIRR